MPSRGTYGSRWRPELVYGLYLAARARNWEAVELYDDFATTRFVLPLDAEAQLDRLTAHHRKPRYVVLTCALHNLEHDPLVRPPGAGAGSAIARPRDRRFAAG